MLRNFTRNGSKAAFWLYQALPYKFPNNEAPLHVRNFSRLFAWSDFAPLPSFDGSTYCCFCR